MTTLLEIAEAVREACVKESERGIANAIRSLDLTPILAQFGDVVVVPIALIKVAQNVWDTIPSEFYGQQMKTHSRALNDLHDALQVGGGMVYDGDPQGDITNG